MGAYPVHQDQQEEGLLMSYYISYINHLFGSKKKKTLLEDGSGGVLKAFLHGALGVHSVLYRYLSMYESFAAIYLY